MSAISAAESGTWRLCNAPTTFERRPWISGVFDCLLLAGKSANIACHSDGDSAGDGVAIAAWAVAAEAGMLPAYGTGPRDSPGAAGSIAAITCP